METVLHLVGLGDANLLGDHEVDHQVADPNNDEHIDGEDGGVVKDRRLDLGGVRGGLAAELFEGARVGGGLALASGVLAVRGHEDGPEHGLGGSQLVDVDQRGVVEDAVYEEGQGGEVMRRGVSSVRDVVVAVCHFFVGVGQGGSHRQEDHLSGGLVSNAAPVGRRSFQGWACR